MPLTHVYYWQEQRWRKINIEEAARLHPHGAAAQSGFFRCSICDQYVGLTKEGIYSSYFHHSSAEKDKECADRSAYSNYGSSYRIEAHGLPLKLIVEGQSRFSFELGLLPVPSEMKMPKDGQIRITGSSQGIPMIYSLERLLPDTVTYLDVGEEPQSSYRLQPAPNIPSITAYWPQEVEGVASEGTVFDTESGKRLPAGADVIVNRHYYLLTTRPVKRFVEDVAVKDICSKRLGFTTWSVYEIYAKGYSKLSADYFLDYHCRLTDEPVQMIPVWPLCIRSPYVFRHNSKELFLYFKGDATPKMYPSGTMRLLPASGPKLIYVSSACRQQMVALGRAKVLKYAYFWQQKIQNQSVVPSPSITDCQGEEIELGDVSPVPPKGSVTIELPCDGTVEVSVNGFTEQHYDLKAAEKFTLDHIRQGQTLSVYAGCDLCRRTLFQKRGSVRKGSITDELKECNGVFVPAGHSLGSVIMKFPDDEELRKYIYQAVRSGKIREDALNILKASVMK